LARELTTLGGVRVSKDQFPVILKDHGVKETILTSDKHSPEKPTGWNIFQFLVMDSPVKVMTGSKGVRCGLEDEQAESRQDIWAGNQSQGA
jgi:hypothetical protein